MNTSGEDFKIYTLDFRADITDYGNHQ